MFCVTNSCSFEQQNKTLLTDSEWNDILFLMKSSIPNNAVLYYQYENTQMKNLLESVYISASEILNYKVNDSIIEEILTRQNIKVRDDIIVDFKINYIRDTTDCLEYNVLTEPFYINTDIIYLSMRYRNLEEKNSYLKVLFFQKQGGKLKLINFYDANMDTFYSIAPNSILE